MALDHLLAAFLAGMQPDFVPAALLAEVVDRAFPSALQAQEQLTHEFEAGLAAATVLLWENIVRALPEEQATTRSSALTHLSATLLLRAESVSYTHL